MRRGHRRVKTHHRIESKRTPLGKKRANIDALRVDNTADIDLILSKGKIMQELLGFSKEGIGRLFEQALSYLNANYLDEAKSSFSILTRLNPYVSDFWLGLGVSHMRDGEFRKAFDAFSMALAMDPLRIDVYSYAIDCCLEMNLIQQAEGLLNDAVTYAKRSKKSPDGQLILQSEVELRERIQRRKAS